MDYYDLLKTESSCEGGDDIPDVEMSAEEDAQWACGEDKLIVMEMVANLRSGPTYAELVMPPFMPSQGDVRPSVAAIGHAAQAVPRSAAMNVSVVGRERMEQVAAQAKLVVDGQDDEYMRKTVVPSWVALRLVDVPGDGDCIFTSTIAWLRALGLDVTGIETGPKLRAATLKACTSMLDRATAAKKVEEAKPAPDARIVASLTRRINELQVVQAPLQHLERLSGERAIERYTVPETIHVLHALLQKRFSASACPAFVVVEASAGWGGMEVVIAGLPSLPDGSSGTSLPLIPGRYVMLMNSGNHYYAAVPTRAIHLMVTDVDALNLSRRGLVVPPWCVEGDEDGSLAAATTSASVRRANCAPAVVAAEAASKQAELQRRFIDARKTRRVRQLRQQRPLSTMAGEEVLVS